MTREMPETPIPPNGLPLPGLLEIVEEALFAEFRAELVKAGHGGVRPGHGCVFRFVREDGMRLTDLASAARITKQSAGEIVDALADLGYVERVPDPADRRAKLIQLTEKGKEAQATGLRLFGELEQRWAERYGKERIAELRDLLEEIAAAQDPAAVPELAAHEPAAVQ
jgi:DNA-binding MarR family transcriptional regulator